MSKVLSVVALVRVGGKNFFTRGRSVVIDEGCRESQGSICLLLFGSPFIEVQTSGAFHPMPAYFKKGVDPDTLLASHTVFIELAKEGKEEGEDVLECMR